MNLQQLQQQRQEEVRKELMCEEWDEYYPIELSLGHLDTITAASVLAGYLLALEEVEDRLEHIMIISIDPDDKRQGWYNRGVEEAKKELATLKAQAEALAGKKPHHP